MLVYKKCCYIDKNALPPSATTAQRNLLCDAILNEKVKLTSKALKYVNCVWKIPYGLFVKKILEHLNSDHALFLKFERGTRSLLKNHFQASVIISEPDPEDDYDDGSVYVELILADDNIVVYIRDAHEHEFGIKRLPIKI